MLNKNRCNFNFAMIPPETTVVLSMIRRRRRRREGRRRREFFAYLMQRKKRILLLSFVVAAALTIRPSLPRSVWSLPKSLHWWETIVLATWGDEEYLANFRMTENTFNFILRELRHRIERRDTKFRKAIRPEHRLAITLWRLATNIEYRTLAGLFGVGRSTVGFIVLDTCREIIAVFKDRMIQIPSGQRLQECLDRFSGRFPQAVCAIDGSHIPIKAPKNNPRDYFNRKGYYSIILQAVVDSFGMFIDLNVGWPGSVHDARVFTNSRIYQRLQNNTLFPPQMMRIGDCNIPLLVLGDPAYPLLPNLLKPFSDNGRLTPDQIVFNNRLSSCRIVVEHAFGRLKGRWRILSKTCEHDLTNMSKIVTACCILHNIVEKQNNPYLDHWNIQPPNEPQPHNGNNQRQVQASAVRNAIVQYFAQQ